MSSLLSLMDRRAATLLASLFFSPSFMFSAPPPLELSREEYVDRINAIWHGQIIAVTLTIPFEHQVSAVRPVHDYPKPRKIAWVDDDWYYEIAALRAFERHGINLDANQLGEQWLANNCGSYGSSSYARLNLINGISGSLAGNPRYNPFWWTIGPVFSSDLYGALCPGQPNTAAQITRNLGRINGYGEALDGAVIWAGAISLAFSDHDPRSVLRRAILLVDSSSPYRQAIEFVIAQAETGKTFHEITTAVEDRYRPVYTSSNNAVSNGAIAAATLWFCEGDFWKAINLAASAADFSDTDNSAASAVSVLAAMKGMKILPSHLVAQLGDRIVGDVMGDVALTPPVDERISDLARRSAAIGEQLVLAHGARIEDGDRIVVPLQSPVGQPAQRFTPGDLTAYWNADWKLDRSAYGPTRLENEVLYTYPADERRAAVFTRTLRLPENATLRFEVVTPSNRQWDLSIYVDNTRVLDRLFDGDEVSGFQPVALDLSAYAGQDRVIRVFHKVRQNKRDKLPATVGWKNLRIE